MKIIGLPILATNGMAHLGMPYWLNGLISNTPEYLYT